MSAPELNLLGAAAALQTPISAADLKWARLESYRSDKSMTALLEQRVGGTPEEFLARLSCTLRMPAAPLEELRSEAPAFDLIPYAEASRRSCLALRNAEGRLSVVLGDPYDVETQDWIDEQIHAPF